MGDIERMIRRLAARKIAELLDDMFIERELHTLSCTADSYLKSGVFNLLLNARIRESHDKRINKRVSPRLH